MEKSESETEMENLEKEILDELDNPYRTYSVRFPYTVSFTIPDDDHQTKVTIESKSEVLRYGKDEQDIHHQMKLDQAHGRDTYAKHLVEWTKDRMSWIEPNDVTVTYDGHLTIKPMTDEEIDEFREGCLSDE